MGRSPKQLARWAKDIKLVMPVGQTLTSNSIAKILHDFDWSTHQKKLGRGARSKRLFPSVMEVCAALKKSPDFEMVKINNSQNAWRRKS